MPRDIDALTSLTLKHLRERWWDPAFTTFLRETLRPRPGDRLLEVGCGRGTAALALAPEAAPLRLVGIDRDLARVSEAVVSLAEHEVRARLAVADAVALPFASSTFDASFAVAVLQHVRQASQALAELARVTRPGGRVIVVEPDNRARYWFSSSETGLRAFEMGTQFFLSVATARGDRPDLALGPNMPALLLGAGVTPLAVRLFPVSVTRLGAPDASMWAARKAAVRLAAEAAPDEATERLGADYLKMLDRYAEDAARLGPRFVEIQHTMLFATIGQRGDG
jgi:SAM-dependent methyltransferase